MLLLVSKLTVVLLPVTCLPEFDEKVFFHLFFDFVELVGALDFEIGFDKVRDVMIIGDTFDVVFSAKKTSREVRKKRT